MTDISQFKPKTVYVTYIASTPEKVWQALTEAEFSRQYFFGFTIDVEPKTGGAFYYRYPDGRVHISGKGTGMVAAAPLRLHMDRGSVRRTSRNCRNASSPMTSSRPAMLCG